jgi:hypothetical protein
MTTGERRVKAYELGLLRLAAMPDSMKRSLIEKHGPVGDDEALRLTLEALIADADRKITGFMDDSRHRGDDEV